MVEEEDNRVRTKTCYVGVVVDDDDGREMLCRHRAWKNRLHDKSAMTWVEDVPVGAVVVQVERPPVPVSVEKPSNPSS